MTWVTKSHTLREEAQQNQSGEYVSKTVDENLNGLYQLSLLLTGDRKKARQCVVAGIEKLVSGNHAFNQWAHSWAKRIIIENAIRELKPRKLFAHTQSTETVFPNAGRLSTPPRGHFKLEAILALEDFERFVFVLSVLEHYSEHVCARFLDCSVSEIREARTHALDELISSLRMSFPDNRPGAGDQVSKH